MSAPSLIGEPHRITRAVQAACIQAALEGYERAAQDGLCHAGAWEAAVEAIRALNVDTLVQKLNQESAQQRAR